MRTFTEVYEEIALNCFRYLDFKSFKEIDELTITEYELLMKAVALRLIDMDYRNHLQAFLNFSVQAKKRAGKKKVAPVYDKFSKFFDYKKAVDEVIEPKKKKSRFSGIGKLLKKGG